jgi:glycosyltransferase involved in cell wall biosynthesis
MTTLPAVGFDGFYLEHPMTGSGQYAVNLWEQLRRRDELRAVLLAPEPAAVGRLKLPPKARKLWWEQSGLPGATRRADVSLVHVPYFAAPLRQRVPHVVTVHDVIPLALPAYGGTAQMRLYLRLVSRAARKARLVLTDSEHARSDIVARLAIPPERIRVTPLAAAGLYQPVASYADEEAVGRMRARFGLIRPFVLNVGGYDARKRLAQVIRGFALTAPAIDPSVEYDLVIAGAPHSGNPALYPPLDPVIAQLGLNERVRQLGFVSDEDKRDLYRAAAAFVFASEYEGFGLTPLEALACGAPVICSNRSSLPEVVGDAGLLIDPEPQAIAAALTRVLSEPDLRARLSARAPERAKLFSWERTANLTVNAYREALGLAGVPSTARQLA